MPHVEAFRETMKWQLERVVTALENVEHAVHESSSDPTSYTDVIRIAKDFPVGTDIPVGLEARQGEILVVDHIQCSFFGTKIIAEVAFKTNGATFFLAEPNGGSAIAGFSQQPIVIFPQEVITIDNGAEGTTVFIQCTRRRIDSKPRRAHLGRQTERISNTGTHEDERDFAAHAQHAVSTK